MSVFQTCSVGHTHRYANTPNTNSQLSICRHMLAFIMYNMFEETSSTGPRTKAQPLPLLFLHMCLCITDPGGKQEKVCFQHCRSRLASSHLAEESRNSSQSQRRDMKEDNAAQIDRKTGRKTDRRQKRLSTQRHVVGQVLEKWRTQGRRLWGRGEYSAM